MRFITRLKSFGYDGPYIFEEDSIFSLIYSNGFKWGGYQIEKQELSEKELLSRKFICRADKRKETSFSFKLYLNFEIPPVYYESPEKIFIVADIEGNFYAFEELLKGNKIIDDNFNWAFGNNHLVILGDLFDRGMDVLPCIWLTFKLEKQAEQAGGKVHVLLGNHEQFALNGIDRYAHSKYNFFSRNQGLTYKDLFSKKNVLGKWIRTKNAIEIIGKTLFTHAGISRQIANLDLSAKEINDTVRKYIDQYNSDSLSAEAEIILGTEGVLWYRGWVGDEFFYKKDSAEQVNSVLKKLNVEKAIIGHTIVNDISSDYNGKIIRCDILQPYVKKQGAPKALLIENNKFYRVNNKGEKETIH